MGVGRPGLGTLPCPTARRWGVRSGPAIHWLWVRGVWAWGPVTNPTALALASWLCALWGRHEGPRGGCLLPCCGTFGVGRFCTPNRPSLRRGAGARDPLAVGAGIWAWGPVTNPTARAPACWLCAPWERPRGAGGGASCLRVWRPRLGALPRPAACPCGFRPGPATHWLGGGGACVGTRDQRHCARSCELGFRALGPGQGRLAVGASCLARGDAALGALPRPTARPCGVQPGPATHGLWVLGMWAWEPGTYPTAHALASLLCALWRRHEGARGGASPAWCGASRVGRSPTPDRPSLGLGALAG